MANNFLSNLKEKNKIMKLLIVTLVGALVYDSASLYSADAMKRGAPEWRPDKTSAESEVGRECTMDYFSRLRLFEQKQEGPNDAKRDHPEKMLNVELENFSLDAEGSGFEQSKGVDITNTQQK